MISIPVSLALAFLLLAAAPEGLAARLDSKTSTPKPNMMTPKNCNSSGRHCTIDASGFNISKTGDGDISQIDLGNGRNFACRSNNSNGKQLNNANDRGGGGGGGAMFHAECTGSVVSSSTTAAAATHGSGGGGGGGGAMNAITHGKNSQGQDRIYASVNVDGEVCRIHPDADGEEIVVDCAPLKDFPPEADYLGSLHHDNDVDGEEIFNMPMVGSAGSDTADVGRRFRELVIEPVDQKRATVEQRSNYGVSSISLRRGSRSNVQHYQHGRGLQVVDDSGATLDIMVLWSKKAECKHSQLEEGCTHTQATEDNMRGLINLAIDETNTAFNLSGILTSLRLVHAYREETFTESPITGLTFLDALDKLASTNDGVMDDVHTKRTRYGADLVAMLIDDDHYCGIASPGPGKEKMFSVTAWNCATGVYSFGHEIGHNMGCLHDKGETNSCDTTDYHHGYRDPQAEFRTILAYDCTSGQCDENAGGECERIQRFSNSNYPTYQYNGKAIGDETADNARLINEVRAEIAAYEVASPACVADGDCDDGDLCTTDACDGVCVHDPIDCDDGNACSVDSCSAGICVNTAFSCDDGNACTVDACDAYGGCSITPVPGCCGNDVCEPGFGESSDVCFDDCSLGPFLLDAPPCSSCAIRAGHMFDVKTKDKDVAIVSIDMFYLYGEIAEVWTRSGTHVGHENSASGWTKVAERDFSFSGRGSMVTMSATTFIPAKSRQAFYITFPAGRMLYHSGRSSTRSIVVEDDNLIMYGGPAVEHPFGSRTRPKKFSGGITYMSEGTFTQAPVTSSPVTGAPSLTVEPSSIPSESPSISTAPSGQPSKNTSSSDWPTSQPSSEPSSHPSTNPYLSSMPSGQPSENPSVSDSPTSQPSGLPSISTAPSMHASLSSIPSGQPSENPSESGWPTLQPSESPSISTAPSMNPSLSSMPSGQPSENPSMSALPPTKKPTRKPVTCKDNRGWRYYHTGWNQRVKCAWIVRKPHWRCRLIGIDGRQARDACPKSCDTC